jgi:hypothetical protein
MEVRCIGIRDNSRKPTMQVGRCKVQTEKIGPPQIPYEFRSDNGCYRKQYRARLESIID